MKRSLGALLVLVAIAAVAAARPGKTDRRPGRAPVDAVPAASPWASPEACSAALAAGMRAPRPDHVARLATWNVRWFPDGNPGRPAKSGGGPRATNLEWLACGIAFLGADVVAFLEMKSTPESADALAVVKARLDTLTRGAWRAEIDRCPGRGRQSVALLFDERRVAAGSFQNLASMNPHGGACDQNLRPGFGGYFRFPGGADLHVVGVHLKSGTDARARELREASLAGIADLYRDVQGAAPDADVVLLGDFNTMGCDECRPRLEARDEIAAFGAKLSAASVPFRRVPSDGECSEYYRGRGHLLDHFAVTASMREAPAGARAHVDGYCGAVSCGRLDPDLMPRAYRELSDHCPLVLDLVDRDLD